MANHFPVKNAPDFRILHIQGKNITGVMPPPPPEAPWCLGPDTNCLASVPIVPVLRNDHWLTHALFVLRCRSRAGSHSLMIRYRNYSAFWIFLL